LKTISGFCGLNLVKLTTIAREGPNSKKSGRKLNDPVMEEMLTKYVLECSRRGRYLGKSEIQLIAKQFSIVDDFHASIGWFNGFLVRAKKKLPKNQRPDFKVTGRHEHMYNERTVSLIKCLKEINAPEKVINSLLADCPYLQKV